MDNNIYLLTGTRKLSNDHLAAMECLYKVMPELQGFLSIYNSDRERARKKRKLRHFPTFSRWRSEGSPQPAGGLIEDRVTLYHQHTADSKQHSTNCPYVSRQHHVKRASTVCLLDLSEAQKRFGVVEELYCHEVANKKFMWALVNLYKDTRFDLGNGLWFSCKDNYGQIMPVPLNKLSHPLTIAVDDSFIWFLDVHS